MLGLTVPLNLKTHLGQCHVKSFLHQFEEFFISVTHQSAGELLSGCVRRLNRAQIKHNVMYFRATVSSVPTDNNTDSSCTYEPISFPLNVINPIYNSHSVLGWPLNKKTTEQVVLFTFVCVQSANTGKLF